MIINIWLMLLPARNKGDINELLQSHGGGGRYHPRINLDDSFHVIFLLLVLPHIHPANASYHVRPAAANLWCQREQPVNPRAADTKFYTASAIPAALNNNNTS